MNGFVTASWVVHVPRQSVALAASPGPLSLALLCMAIGSVAGMTIAPSAIARVGAARTAAIAGVVYALLLPLPLLAISILGLGLALLAFGCLHGLMDVSMNAEAAACESALGRPIMAGIHGWFSVGMVAGVAGGVAALTAGLPPESHALCAIIVAVLLLATAWPRAQSAPVHQTGGSPAIALNRQIVILCGLSFVCLFLEGAMADWAGLLAVAFGATAAEAPLAYGAFTVTWAGGRFLGDQLTSRLGDAAAVRSGGLFTAVGMAIALMGATPGSVVAGSAVVGLGLANTVPILFRAAARGDASGRGLALVTGVGYFGFLVGPPLVGFTGELVGLPRAVLLVVAGGLLLAAGASALPHLSQFGSDANRR